MEDTLEVLRGIVRVYDSQIHHNKGGKECLLSDVLIIECTNIGE